MEAIEKEAMAISTVQGHLIGSGKVIGEKKVEKGLASKIASRGGSLEPAWDFLGLSWISGISMEKELGK